ncbi:class I SAM-dependent rRNA methyltransferase [Algoriphagus sediminis]|uniref:Class I SAM-dependent rRNA methyltransferase n=1 Tax=Algoriphagus sediminis TaxID=3057113 RepID=A0ABT7YDQ3_9BACT|nr:class I SAM-dependent rRNA methyltransferase [Algoriphagus sediminis]MDN3204627.1 class I SAM-dependent rRNA methyltransferase [Algoriphagus sediminis]
MDSIPELKLKKGKEISLRRRHHWVFSGAISYKDPTLSSGDLVRVLSSRDEFLGLGHYAKGSIMVRILSFEDINIDQGFWDQKISAAIQHRKKVGLLDSEKTNVFRLVHGEGDGIPGLIIDFYNGTAVIQCHDPALLKYREAIAKALKNGLSERLHAVYDKSQDVLPREYQHEVKRFLLGEPKTDLVVENGCKYKIDWEKGQKTGFFIDQRENRALLGEYSRGKKVLNTFCYSGAFSVMSLLSGASEVHSVDISESAIKLTEENLELNPEFKGIHKSIQADVVKYIREIGNDFDVIVLDPPAFAKNMKARHNAVQAYKRLNLEALKKIKTGGILFTFSCSQVVDKALFRNTIVAAALESKRGIKILHQLSQPADHPVNIYHPETEYLKGLVLYVE